MSAEAMAAVYRLEIRPYLDGRCMQVLQYLAWRHSKVHDSARPSLARMQADLDIEFHSILLRALRRLESAGLVKRQPGGGRGKATRYRLLFLYQHRLSPGDTPIRIERKGGLPRACNKEERPRPPLTSETGALTHINRGSEDRKQERSRPSKRRKSLKGPPASAEGRAGGPENNPSWTDADRVFNERLAHNQSAKGTES